MTIYSPLQMATDLPENYEGQPAFQVMRGIPGARGRPGHSHPSDGMAARLRRGALRSPREFQALRSLARALGVHTHYTDGLGKRVAVAPETLVRVRAAVGARTQLESFIS